MAAPMAFAIKATTAIFVPKIRGFGTSMMG
jgi:hypothetical protein